MKWEVYFARCVAPNGADMGAIKIGCSHRLDSRITQLSAGEPFRCELLTKFQGTSFSEAAIHFLLRAHKIRGEYFHAEPPVMEMVNRVKRTGVNPLPIKERGEKAPYVWMKMPQVVSFMERHDISAADVADVTGAREKTYANHITKNPIPNRRFVAALTVAAIERGHEVEWPHSFRLPEKAAA